MSLINKIEVSCFLDSSQTENRNIEAWRPDFMGFIIDMAGKNTLVNMENGAGKTCICDAVIAILSRRRELISRTKGRMAPKAKNCYSHVRVELIVQYDTSQEDMYVQMGEDVPGEKHVLGIYGNEGANSDVIFYHYQGELNDCPVAMQEGLKVSLVPDEEFRKKLLALQTAKRGRANAEAELWRSIVAQFFEPQIIEKLADFQLMGAGDTNSNILAVKARRGEDYDVAFFYSMIAPELLVY